MTEPTAPDLRRLRLLLLLAGILLVVAVAGLAGQRFTAGLATSIRSMAAGAEGPVSQWVVLGAAAAFTFLTVLLPLPAEAAAILNGILLPPVPAFILTWTLSFAGAAASYELGRVLGHGPANRLFGADRVARLERLIDRAGWPLLLGLRLSPVMAFTALNWVSGILSLSRPVFYWTTAAGLIPGTLVFTIAPGLLTRRTSGTVLLVGGFALAIGLVAWALQRLRRPDADEVRPAT
ncbi:MAG: TVP38/TMEM64 family protein [Gemmatimonadales bacterium]